MGLMDRHAAGTVCWAELATGDPEGAKRFYRGLFGWDLEDVPIGDGALYTMARLQGLDAAALYQPGGDVFRKPARWRIHVSVPDADAAARRALDRGARTPIAPAEVAGAGRFALVRDPAGAHLGIWQAQGHIGAEVMGIPGALAWAELVARDVEGARRFYADWLGWDMRLMEPGGYALFLKEGRPVAGMVRMEEEPPGAEAHWRVYFQTADCGASSEKARGLGGSCRMPPTRIPGVGTVALFADPQGGVFSLLQAASGTG